MRRRCSGVSSFSRGNPRARAAAARGQFAVTCQRLRASSRCSGVSSRQRLKRSWARSRCSGVMASQRRVPRSRRCCCSAAACSSGRCSGSGSSVLRRQALHRRGRVAAAAGVSARARPDSANCSPTAHSAASAARRVNPRSRPHSCLPSRAAAASCRSVIFSMSVLARKSEKSSSCDSSLTSSMPPRNSSRSSSGSLLRVAHVSISPAAHS